MHFLVLGATGRTGQRFVRRAIEHHQVTSFGRRASNLAQRSLTGQFGDDAFVSAVHDADVVVSCLASSNADPVCSTAAKAVLAADPKARFLTVAGAGVDMPDDNKGMADKTIGLIMRVVVGKMLADRQKEVDMLADSSAAWTAMRPPRLVDDREQGGWAATFDRPANTWIDREDLAAALLDAAESEKHIGLAPFVSAPGKGAT